MKKLFTYIIVSIASITIAKAQWSGVFTDDAYLQGTKTEVGISNCGSFGSRALFSWVWGLAGSSLYPIKPEPVCSAFAVKRSVVIDLLLNLGKELEVGELETQIIPQLINSSNSNFMTLMEVSHFEYVGIRVGAKAIFSNSRITV